MVTARSAAMGFNRLVDARFDAANPRTSSREIPSGRMSTTEAAIFVMFMSVAFVGCRRPAQLAVPLPVASRAHCDLLVLAREALYVGDAVLPRARHGDCACRWMACRRRRRGMGAVAARPGDWAVGRGLRRAVCLPGSRGRSAAAPEVDSRAIRRGALAVDLARDARRHDRLP